MRYYIIGYLVGSVMLVIFFNSVRPYDDTDDIVNKIRSGLSLFTDNKTGCQYIKGGYFNQMTKRVNGEGDHVGCKALK